MKTTHPVDLASVPEMEQTLPVDCVIDRLYDMVHDALLAGQFDVVNVQLLKVDPKLWSTQLLVSLLTVTNAGKHRLSHRLALREKIRVEFTKRYPPRRVERLMAGF